jgi:hypothetical protein
MMHHIAARRRVHVQQVHEKSMATDHVAPAAKRGRLHPVGARAAPL